MEAVFDNKNNVVNAQIRAVHDNSIIYSIQSTFSWSGRKLTVLRDANPGPEFQARRENPIVGAIHWQEKIIEVQGHKKKFGEVKRREGRFFNRYFFLFFSFCGNKLTTVRRTRQWCWAPGRKEYEVAYHKDEWKVTSLRLPF